MTDITPPLELVRKWQREANHNEPMFPQVAAMAAQWGYQQHEKELLDAMHSTEPPFSPMAEHNLPDKDDAPWLDCMDGFKDKYEPLSKLSSAAQAVLHAYRSSHLSINNLVAALRALVKNCSGVDYEGGRRIASVVCADILAIADEIENNE